MTTKFTEEDLMKTAELLEKAYNLEGEIAFQMEEVIANLDWASLSTVKHTRHVAEEMGLIEESTSEEAWVALCQEIYDEIRIPINEVTVAEFVDLLFWKSIFTLIKVKDLQGDAGKEYIRRWLPDFKSKYFKLNPYAEITKELSLKQLDLI